MWSVHEREQGHPKSDLGMRLCLSNFVSVRIESLKARHDITKLDFTVLLLSLICIDINFSIQTHMITCIVHDLDAIEVVQKIQFMGFLKDDKLFTIN